MRHHNAPRRRNTASCPRLVDIRGQLREELRRQCPTVLRATVAGPPCPQTSNSQGSSGSLIKPRVHTPTNLAWTSTTFHRWPTESNAPDPATSLPFLSARDFHGVRRTPSPRAILPIALHRSPWWHPYSVGLAVSGAPSSKTLRRQAGIPETTPKRVDTIAPQSDHRSLPHSAGSPIAHVRPSAIGESETNCGDLSSNMPLYTLTEASPSVPALAQPPSLVAPRTPVGSAFAARAHVPTTERPRPDSGHRRYPAY